jgi:hypothetical protein
MEHLDYNMVNIGKQGKMKLPTLPDTGHRDAKSAHKPRVGTGSNILSSEVVQWYDAA